MEVEATSGNKEMNRFVAIIARKLEPDTRRRLTSVYTTLSLGCGLCAAGSYFRLLTADPRSLAPCMKTTSLLLVFTIWFCLTPPGIQNKNLLKRLLLYGIITILVGCNVAPLINIVVNINPQIVLHAALGSSLLFVCLSLCAIFAPKSYYLYLAGAISTLLLMRLYICFYNLFMLYVLNSPRVFQVESSWYVVAVVACLYILYDTQKIVDTENSQDYISDSLLLFIDLFVLFEHILRLRLSKDVVEWKKKRLNKKIK